MAATFVSEIVNFGGIGGHASLKRINLDLGTYATGGVALTAAICRVGALVDVSLDGAGGYQFEWDTANQKVLAKWVDTTVDGAVMGEVTTATDLGSVDVPAWIIYRP